MTDLPTDDDFDRLLDLLESGITWGEWILAAVTTLGPEMFEVLRKSLEADGVPYTSSSN